MATGIRTPCTHEPGHVYTLHFHKPVRVAPRPPGADLDGVQAAGHYTGFAFGDLAALERRIERHRAGNAANLTAVAHRLGIGFDVVDVRPGCHCVETKLKKQGGASRRCPTCKAEARAASQRDGR